MVVTFGAMARGAIVALVSLIAFPTTAVELTVSSSGGNDSSPLLYGFMFEDISRSGDGGVSAQLLQNNGFQGTTPNLTAYAAVGGTTLSVDANNPLSKAITNSLKVEVPNNAADEVGFLNEGYAGILVIEATYTSTFYIKGAYTGDVTLRLVGKSSQTVFASKTVGVTSSGSRFTEVTTTLDATAAPDGNNIWTLTLPGKDVAGKTLYFDLIQLYPPTFHDRPNGLKPQLADPINAIGGKFLRFPGGNNLEGPSPDQRFKWNETIGPLTDRPGHLGAWWYPNSDALGLNEYFLWAQDMGLAPLLGIYAGFSIGHDNVPGEAITGEALEPYIDDVIDELEYILGGVDTKYGALRASHGFPEPWPLQHVEIGNEDNIWGGGPTYPERFARFHDRIHAAYPDLILMASTDVDAYLPHPYPASIWRDYHTYAVFRDMVSLFPKFDNVDRAFPYGVTEFAARVRDDGTIIQQPEMQGTVAEAVFMIGMERNSDVVKMAAYAPLVAHNDFSQWTPNLIPFDNNADSVILSTSYYGQQIFAQHHGNTVLPIQSDSGFGPLYWVATKTGSTYYVKIANYGANEEKVTVKIDGASSNGRLTVISGAATAANTAANKNAVTPQVSDVSATDGAFALTLPAWSIAALAVGA